MNIIYDPSLISFLFFTLIFQLTKTLASPTDELILAGGQTEDTTVEDNTAPRYSKEKGFECGNIFFHEIEVNEALTEGLRRFSRKLEAQRYRGPLYSDAESQEYLLFTIKKKVEELPSQKCVYSVKSSLVSNSHIKQVYRVIVLLFTDKIRER